MTINKKMFGKGTVSAVVLCLLLVLCPVFHCSLAAKDTGLQKQYLSVKQDKDLKKTKKRQKTRSVRKAAGKIRPSERITADQAVAFPPDI